jgi:hypothetical protein
MWEVRRYIRGNQNAGKTLIRIFFLYPFDPGTQVSGPFPLWPVLYTCANPSLGVLQWKGWCHASP